MVQVAAQQARAQQMTQPQLGQRLAAQAASPFDPAVLASPFAGLAAVGSPSFAASPRSAFAPVPRGSSLPRPVAAVGVPQVALSHLP